MTSHASSSGNGGCGVDGESAIDAVTSGIYYLDLLESDGQQVDPKCCQWQEYHLLVTVL